MAILKIEQHVWHEVSMVMSRLDQAILPVSDYVFNGPVCLNACIPFTSISGSYINKRPIQTTGLYLQGEALHKQHDWPSSGPALDYNFIHCHKNVVKQSTLLNR